MTLEESFARLALNSGRIADALEAIAGSQGIVSGEIPPGDAPAETKPAASKKTTKKAAKKKTVKKTVGKKEAPAEEESELTIKDDVRPVLKRLRDEVSHAAVKSLLKKYGASTIQQLDSKNFQRIIDDAIEDIGEPEDAGLDDDDDDI
jgi:hypothetical protein